MFNDGLLDNKLFAVDLDTHVFSVNTITVDRHINAANITLTSNVVAPNFLFANGVNILSTVNGTYSNTNVAAYLTTATINTTGNLTSSNITATGYVHGDGSKLSNLTYNQVGNIVGTSSNVTLAAGSYDWTFDNTGNLTYPNGSRTKTAYKETIGYNNQVATVASGSATITNWSSSYTGTGGNIKVTLMFTAYGTSTGLKTFNLQRDGVTVSNSSFYVNTTLNHYPMLPLVYIDTTGNTSSHTYSIVIPSGVSVDTNDFATITFTEF